MRPDSLGIVGLDANGLAVAAAASEQGSNVLAWGELPATSAAAARAGAIHRVALRPGEVIRDGDLVIFAGTADRVIHQVREHAASLRDLDRLFTTITEITSPVREAVIEAGLKDLHAGSWVWAHAGAVIPRAGLVHVTSTNAGEWAPREIAHFWESLCDAQVVHLTEQMHDELIAALVQLPEMVAVAATNVMAESVRKRAASSDAATAILASARVDASTWTNEAVHNQQHVTRLLDVLLVTLGEMREAVATGNEAGLRDQVETARRIAGHD